MNTYLFEKKRIIRRRKRNFQQNLHLVYIHVELYCNDNLIIFKI